MESETTQEQITPTEVAPKKSSNKVALLLLLIILPILLLTLVAVRERQIYRQLAAQAAPNFCSGEAVAASADFKAKKDLACQYQALAAEEVLKTKAGCPTKADAEKAVVEACAITSPAAKICSGKVIAASPFFKAQDKAEFCGAFYGNALDGLVKNLPDCANRDEAKKSLDEACTSAGVTPSNKAPLAACSCDMIMGSNQFMSQKTQICTSSAGKGIAADQFFGNSNAGCTSRDQALQIVEKVCTNTCSEPAAPAAATGSTTSAPGCGAPGDAGNEKGVGKYCSKGGGQCKGLEAAVCPQDIDETFPGVCSKGCTTDADCGTGATCYQDALGKGCKPSACAVPTGGTSPTNGPTSAVSTAPTIAQTTGSSKTGSSSGEPSVNPTLVCLSSVSCLTPTQPPGPVITSGSTSKDPCANAKRRGRSFFDLIKLFFEFILRLFGMNANLGGNDPCSSGSGSSPTGGAGAVPTPNTGSTNPGSVNPTTNPGAGGGVPTTAAAATPAPQCNKELLLADQQFIDNKGFACGIAKGQAIDGLLNEPNTPCKTKAEAEKALEGACK